MSTKRSSAMSKINDFATTEQIKNASSSDEAVNLFLHGPNATNPPGTQPSKQTKTIGSNVAGREVDEDVTIKGPSTLDKTVNEVVGTGQSLASGTYNGLSNVPIPGGIGVPFTILMVLFLALLPINGHTRLMWIWLSLTGQAEIGGPLVPPVQATATPTGASGNYSYNTGSPSVNPNQTGTSSTKPAAATKIVSSSKHTTVVKTNTSKTHGTTAHKNSTSSSSHKGGGPGPMDPSIPDPTAPIAQLSYVQLLGNRNGYE